jgi:hypothetical protein
MGREWEREGEGKSGRGRGTGGEGEGARGEGGGERTLDKVELSLAFSGDNHIRASPERMDWQKEERGRLTQ